MEVLVAQVFRVVLLLICDLSTNSMTQSYTDAPIEANFKAETNFSNQSDRDVLVHTLCTQITSGVSSWCLGEAPPFHTHDCRFDPPYDQPKVVKMCDT